jgi:hypothetical protein
MILCAEVRGKPADRLRRRRRRELVTVEMDQMTQSPICANGRCHVSVLDDGPIHHRMLSRVAVAQVEEKDSSQSSAEHPSPRARFKRDRAGLS